MAPLLARIARRASRRWRRSLALAALVFVALGALAGTVGGSFTDDFSVPGTDSQQAIDLLEDRFLAAAHEGATVLMRLSNTAHTSEPVLVRETSTGHDQAVPAADRLPGDAQAAGARLARGRPCAAWAGPPA
jgi:hypothetical protein